MRHLIRMPNNNVKIFLRARFFLSAKARFFLFAHFCSPNPCTVKMHYESCRPTGKHIISIQRRPLKGRTGTLTEPAPDGGFVIFDTPLTPGTLPACGWVPAEHMEVIA